MNYYDSFLKEPVISAICFMSNGSEVLVTIKSKSGYSQIDRIPTMRLQDWIRELDEKTTNFNLGTNFTDKLEGSGVIKRFGKPVVLTYVYSRGRHIAALSRTLDKSELRDQFVNSEHFEELNYELAKLTKKEHSQIELSALESIAEQAQKKYEILVGEFHVPLSDTNFYEFELREDPLCTAIGWGTFTELTFPHSVCINDIALRESYIA
ncbi:hypothetical protein HFM15_002677 [Vibrio cholerae]|nr:hypothetical protein [Vibrio cholerae]